MKILATVAVISFFFILLHSLSSTIAAASSKLVDGVCEKTQQYSDCVSGLELDKRTASASDLKALAIIALDIGEANTTESKSFINKLATDKSTDPRLVPALKLCVMYYAGAAGSFRSAKEEVDEDILTANYDAKVAGDGAATCDRLVKETHIDVPSITTRNYYLSLYSEIGFVITGLLQP